MEQDILDRIFPRAATGLGGLWYGVYPALVTDICDPDGQGQVEVTLPWAPDGASGSYKAWARVATLMGGNNRGSWFIPDKDDEVLVAFAGGDPRHPCVIGGLWNGKDKPPASMDKNGNNDKKVLRSRNGVKITLDDESGQEKLLLETPAGQKVSMNDGGGVLEIQDSNGNSIKLESSGITVTGAAKITLNAPQVEISSSLVKVSSGMSTFSGVVKPDTVITNSVISSSYSPGAGNIW